MKTVDERFFEKVVVDSNGCWIWQGAKSAEGYGFFMGKKKNQAAHRWAYERFKEPIPAGLVIDHLCRVRCCVNANHLEPVSISENAVRGNGPRMLSDWYKARKECWNGHSIETFGFKTFPSGKRYCHECYRINCQKNNAKRRSPPQCVAG